MGEDEDEKIGLYESGGDGGDFKRNRSDGGNEDHQPGKLIEFLLDIFECVALVVEHDDVFAGDVEEKISDGVAESCTDCSAQGTEECKPKCFLAISQSHWDQHDIGGEGEDKAFE